MSLLPQLVAALEREGIAFALIGADAMAVHGVSRATNDIDLLTTDARALAPETWRAQVPPLRSPDVRCGDADDPLAGVVRFRAAGKRPIDLVVGRHAWQRELIARAELREVGEGARLPVVVRSDLILLKLFAGGPQDAWDVEQLLGTPSDPELELAVERELNRLPEESRELWRRLLDQRR